MGNQTTHLNVRESSNPWRTSLSTYTASERGLCPKIGLKVCSS